ncbi:MAG: hypothetical protein U0359_05525 [Byssovorax sp.]
MRSRRDLHGRFARLSGRRQGRGGHRLLRVRGACDVAEEQDGASAASLADAKSPSGTVCRASAGVCDVAETCTGSSSACPSDAFVASGTTTGACATGLLGASARWGPTPAAAARRRPPAWPTRAVGRALRQPRQRLQRRGRQRRGAASCPSASNATSTCTTGACGYTCNAGFGDCDGSTATGCEDFNLQTSNTSCGVCGKACAAGSQCVNGTCAEAASW